MGSYGSSPLSPPAARRTESDHSAFGEGHNRTYPGAPPTAPGVTAVMTAAIPGMATSPPVGGMPIPHQQQQQRQQPALQQQPQMQTQPLSPGAPPSMAQAPPGSIPPGQGAPAHGDPALQQQQPASKRGQHERAPEKERKEGFFSKLFSSGGSRRSREGSEGSRHSAAASPRASTEAGRS